MYFSLCPIFFDRLSFSCPVPRAFVLLWLLIAVGMVTPIDSAHSQESVPETVTDESYNDTLIRRLEKLDGSLNAVIRHQDQLFSGLEDVDTDTQTSVAALKERIEDQNERIADIHAWAGWYGVIIGIMTIMIALGAGISYFFSHRRAIAMVREKINDVKEDIAGYVFEAKKEIDGHLSGVRDKHQEVEAFRDRIKAGEFNLGSDGESSSDINEEAQAAQGKPEENRTFDDWYALGVAASLTEDYDTSVRAFDMAMRLAGTDDELFALALTSKGYNLHDAYGPSAAITAYDELIKRFEEREEVPIKKIVAETKGNRGFAELCLAKEIWGTDREAANGTLESSIIDSDAALLNDPDYPIMLGNKGYALFLINRHDDAMQCLRKALRMGGEKLYKTTLEDIDIHTVPEDAEFRKLVDRLWKEVSAENASNGGGSEKNPG